jgi:hypothetical protein
MEERYAVRFSVEPACSVRLARKVKESIRIRKPVFYFSGSSCFGYQVQHHLRLLEPAALATVVDTALMISAGVFSKHFINVSTPFGALTASKER